MILKKDRSLTVLNLLTSIGLRREHCGSACSGTKHSCKVILSALALGTNVNGGIMDHFGLGELYKGSRYVLGMQGSGSSDPANWRELRVMVSLPSITLFRLIGGWTIVWRAPASRRELD